VSIKKIIGEGNFLGRREIEDGVVGTYIWQSYKKVQERVANFGSGLRKMGLKPKDFLGFFSINTPEYVNIFSVITSLLSHRILINSFLC
jgi:long-subunit acyl-CoA synthetase (AMP-forming)